MLLPAILLAPSVNTSYNANANVYTSDSNGYIYNALAADIAALSLLSCTLVAPRNNVSATLDPVSTDDFLKLYGKGSIWVNIAPANPRVWICTAMGSVGGTATWVQVLSLAGGPADFTGSTVTPTGASGSRTLGNLFADLYNDVKTFGAVGDNSHDDTANIQAAWTAALSNGSPIYFPPGHYKVTGLDFDVTSAHAQIPLIIGAGMNRSIIDAGTTAAPALYLHSTNGNDGFFGGIRDLGFAGNWAGPVLKFCRDDYADAINACGFANINVKNSSANASAEGTRLNYLLNSHFSNLISNTGGQGTGKALVLRQSAFNCFSGGSFSSSQVGVYLTNGFTFGNTFFACDVEVVNYGWLQDSSHAQYNNVIGGTLVTGGGTYGISSTAGGTGGLNFYNVNFGSGGLYGGGVPPLDPANQVGVRIFGNYGDGSSPAMPASGTAVANSTGQTQVVTIWANAAVLTSVTVNGTQTMTISSGSYTSFTIALRNAYNIKLTYSGGTPSWVWYPLGV